MKVGIINASAYYVDNKGICYIRSDEYKSLSQWFDLFDEIVLYKPVLCVDTLPKDWIPLNSNIKVVTICKGNDTLVKKFISIRNIVTDDIDLYYYRLPNFESIFFWLCHKNGKPYFVELHGDMESAIMVGNHNIILKKFLSKVVFFLLRKITNSAIFVLSIGPELLKKYLKTNRPKYVTTNHLLEERDYPNQLPMKDFSSIKILFVGHIHQRKGLIYLFYALRLLYENGINFHINLVGEGELKNFLIEYALKNNFLDKVTFWGQLKHGDQLFSLYKEANVFVLPSIAAEGVPRVIHEAMVFGCPVIATNIGSISWQLEGVGILIPPFDSNAIYQALIKLNNDRAYYEDIRRKAFIKSKSFSLEKQKKGIQEFVKKQLLNIN